MKDLIFKKGIKELEAAFRLSVKKETLEIYFRYLKNISDDEWLRRVNLAIETERSFPSIAVLRLKGGDFADFKVL